MQDKKKVQVVIIAKESNANDKAQGSLLLLKTNVERGEFWQNVTGTLDQGESYKTAALREAMEETGINSKAILSIQELDLIHRFKDQYDKQCIEKSFLITLIGKVDITLSREHLTYQWVSTYDINNSSFFHRSNYESAVKAIQVYKSQFSSAISSP